MNISLGLKFEIARLPGVDISLSAAARVSSLQEHSGLWPFADAKSITHEPVSVPALASNASAREPEVRLEPEPQFSTVGVARANTGATPSRAPTSPEFATRLLMATPPPANPSLPNAIVSSRLLLSGPAPAWRRLLTMTGEEREPFMVTAGCVPESPVYPAVMLNP